MSNEMTKVRRSVNFCVTVEVPDDSIEAVQVVEADKTIEQALECLDGVEAGDCRITGVSQIDCEAI